MECSRYYACNLYIAYTPLDLHVTNPRHNSSRETRLVSREVRRNHKETTVTFTTDLVTRAIRSCSNTKTFGPDKLSIFHLKHLGPRATAYPPPPPRTIQLFRQLLQDPLDLEVFYSHPYPEAWKGHFTRHIIPAHLTHLPSCEGFGSTCTTCSQRSPTPQRRPTWIQTWTLNHLCTTTTYNRHRYWIQPKEATPSDGLRRCRRYCSLCHKSHNVLISKITKSTLPEVNCQWLSCYLRGRQAVTSCRGVKPSARIVHTGVPQGSKLSPSLFSCTVT